MSGKSKEIFERFTQEHVANGDVLPDIDLLMEEGIHNNQWSSFTRDEKVAVSEALALMEKATNGQREAIKNATTEYISKLNFSDREANAQQTYPEVKIIDEDWTMLTPNPETIKTINDMVKSERLHPRINLAKFIEHYGQG